MTDRRVLKLRKDVLTELSADELRAVDGAGASLNTCLDCVTTLVSAAIQTCLTFDCLSGHASCPC